MLIEVDGEFRYKLGEEEITIYKCVKSEDGPYMTMKPLKQVVPIWEYEILVGVFE